MLLSARTVRWIIHKIIILATFYANNFYYSPYSSIILLTFDNETNIYLTFFQPLEKLFVWMSYFPLDLDDRSVTLHLDIPALPAKKRVMRFYYKLTETRKCFVATNEWPHASPIFSHPFWQSTGSRAVLRMFALSLYGNFVGDKGLMPWF